MATNISPEPPNLIKLAPDLDRLGDLTTTNNFVRVTGIDTTGSPTEILGLSGKFAVSMLRISNAAAESVTISMDVDGDTIYSETFTMVPDLTIFAGNTGAAFLGEEAFQVNSTFSLKVQMAADTSIDFDYIVRPIL